MTALDRSSRARVVEVVAGCLEGGRGTAEVMAGLASLRGAAAAERASVSSWATRVLGARLRVERALASCAPELLDDRALGLTLATMVEAGVAPGPWSAALPTQAQLRDAVEALEDPGERFAARHGAPRWVADRLRAQLGDDAAAALRALEAPAPRTLRCNLLRGDRDALQSRLASEGVDVDPGRWAETAVTCRDAANVFATRAFSAGWFEQQDEASQLAVALTAPPPRGRVLDLCAGSGGKTLGVAAALGNRGAVLATDVHEGRLRALRARLARAGADNVTPHLLHGDDAAVARFAVDCDRVLIDAPCTGTGSWRRRPQARVSVTEQDLRALVQTQRELLDRAAAWLKPGARLIYATCSLLAEENAEQVRWLLARRPELELVRIAEVLGGVVAGPITDASGMFLSLRPDLHGCDGFFAAVVRRPRRRTPQRS